MYKTMETIATPIPIHICQSTRGFSYLTVVDKTYPVMHESNAEITPINKIIFITGYEILYFGFFLSHNNSSAISKIPIGK